MVSVIPTERLSQQHYCIFVNIDDKVTAKGSLTLQMTTHSQEKCRARSILQKHTHTITKSIKIMKLHFNYNTEKSCQRSWHIN